MVILTDENMDRDFKSTVSTVDGLHRIERVLLFDSIEDALFCYINERADGRSVYPMSRLKDVLSEFNQHGTERHRYYYHGGEHGVINGFFSYTDSLIYVHPRGDHICITSISPYNKAHFLCDVFDDEEKCESLVEWIGGNVFWKETVENAMESKRERRNHKYG